MAEISALTPSPPTLGDPCAAPSITQTATVQPASSSLTLESLKETPAPKSSLYNDQALTGAASASPHIEETFLAPLKDVQQGPAPSPPEPVLPAEALTENVTPPLVGKAVSQIEEAADIESQADFMSAINRGSNEPQCRDLLDNISETPPQTLSESQIPGLIQQVSPSTDPNLYPSVHVSQTPISVNDDALAVASSPLVPAAVTPITPPIDPMHTTAAATAPATEKHKPTSSDEGLNPHPQTSTPEPDTPKGPDLPSTTSRVEYPNPSVPAIQEPVPSLYLPYTNPRPAPDTLSYLESASVMSGTLESLSGLGEDGSSVGSDSEINGMAIRRTDKYGFLGGSQYSDSGDKDIKIDVARQREMKWLDMFNHWDKWISRRFPKVKLRCRKGIPSSLRAKAWQLLSNSSDLLDANPGKFEELEREPGEPKWLDIIEKDLHRQFPFHEMFAARGGHGQQDLYRILKAYTIYRPDEGYCQAQAPVAAVLLMHMPAEQAFWCLVQICEKYLPGYYSAGLEAIQLDGEIFFSLLRRVCPMAYRHLKKFKIDPILYMTEWFMCIFSRTLPWACVLRVWDMFFCEGVKIVFRVGLVLLKQMLGSVEKLREVQGMYETMERLRNIPPESIREELLVQELIAMPVTEALIERENSIQVRKWRESRGELTHQTGRRLHGTRALHEQKYRAASISSGGSFSFLGSHAPPPGPLRASSSLLSLPGFRKSKMPFRSQAKKGSFSGSSGLEGLPPQPPVSGAGARAQASQAPSPLVATAVGSSVRALPVPPAPSPAASVALTQNPTPHTLSPKVVSEQVTPTIPSPTANNVPLPSCPDPGKGAAAATAGEDDGKQKKRSKEDKKKDKEEEKQKFKEKREKEKAEKERQKKEKERAEKEKRKEKVGKKKDKGGGDATDKNGGTAPRDST